MGEAWGFEHFEQVSLDELDDCAGLRLERFTPVHFNIASGTSRCWLTLEFCKELAGM